MPTFNERFPTLETEDQDTSLNRIIVTGIDDAEAKAMDEIVKNNGIVGIELFDIVKKQLIAEAKLYVPQDIPPELAVTALKSALGLNSDVISRYDTQSIRKMGPPQY